MQKIPNYFRSWRWKGDEAGTGREKLREVVT
jgi:hypothetical protein